LLGRIADAFPRRGPRPGQAEVGDLDLPVRRHQHVARLDVLVDHPPLVRRVQAPGHLDGRVEDLLRARELSAPDPLSQRAALDVLGEDRHPVADRAEEVAGGQVGVLGQVDPGLEFVEEAPALVLVAKVGFQDGFDREPLARGLTADQVHGPHAPLAEKPFDQVIAKDHLTVAPLDALTAGLGRPGDGTVVTPLLGASVGRLDDGLVVTALLSVGR
jgi:hypothetical protein